MNELVVYSDGGARGNPGEAGIGVIISQSNGRVLHEFRGYVGIKTNNQAEYLALIKALELAGDYSARRVKSYLDSELIVRQLKGEYRVRNKILKGFYERVKALERGFERVTYHHVPREDEKIQIADRLVNEAIDAKVKGA